MPAPEIGRIPGWLPSVQPRIDWGHPLAQDLQYCVYARGSSATELVSGRPMTNESNAQTGVNRFGKALSSVGGVAAVNLNAIPVVTYPLSMTWAGVLLFAADVGAGLFCFCYSTSGESGGAETRPFLIGVDMDAGNGLRLNLVDGAVYVYVGLVSGGSVTYGQPSVVTVTVTSGAQQMFLNGVLVASGANTLADPTATNFGYLAFQGYIVTTRRLNAVGNLGLVHTRVLSVAEITSLAVDPFCMLVR